MLIKANEVCIKILLMLLWNELRGMCLKGVGHIDVEVGVGLLLT